MFKSYILIAFRNLQKQKTFTLINLVGMAVGIAGFSLFAHIAGVKLNSDRFHQNAPFIYTMVQEHLGENNQEVHSTFTPAPLAAILQSEFPEIRETARVVPGGQMSLRYRERHFFERGVLLVDPSFLSIFSFKLVAGDPRTALSEPNSLVISEAKALKYFGEDDPVGKTMLLSKDIQLTVKGVSRNIPRTSSLRFDFLLSLGTARSLGWDLTDWESHRYTTFLLVDPEFEQADFEKGLSSYLGKFFTDSSESPRRHYLFPFLDFRLKASHIQSIIASTHPVAVYGIFALGSLLLFVVCVNFVNLGTARSLYRAKEIGLRKVIGAKRSQLIMQFLGESLLLSFLALPVAILFYELLHPLLATYMGTLGTDGFTTQLSNSVFNYPYLLKYMVAAAVLAGLFSGIYPAFFLSSFPTLHVLKGRFRFGTKKKRGSKTLIVVQFAFAVIFIAAASIIKFQFGQLLRADLGFNRQQIAVVRIPEDQASDLELLQTKLRNHTEVVHVSAAAGLPVVWENPQPVRSPDTPEEEAVTMHAYGVDYEFIESLQISLEAGRSFSRKQGDSDSLILSETAVNNLKWENPLGKPLTVGDRTGTVVGVVKDYLFADIGFRIPPTVLFLEEQNLNYLLLRYSSSTGFPDLKNVIATQWASVFPDIPMQCRTLVDYFNDFFQLLGRLANFLNTVGIVAILLSSLGLLGLATYMVEQRTKEIGIRKALGASSITILWKLLREYLFLVALANVVSLGLIYFGWSKVMQTGLLFITNINAGTYIYAFGLTLLTAVVAISSQTLKAALANPADSLRYE
jgi:putative ABC transport system permease protein